MIVRYCIPPLVYIPSKKKFFVYLPPLPSYTQLCLYFSLLSLATYCIVGMELVGSGGIWMGSPAPVSPESRREPPRSTSSNLPASIIQAFSLFQAWSPALHTQINHRPSLSGHRKEVLACVLVTKRTRAYFWSFLQVEQ